MVRRCALALLTLPSLIPDTKADISLSGDASFANGTAVVGQSAEGRLVVTPPSTVTSTSLRIGPTVSPQALYDSAVVIDGATWAATGQVLVNANAYLTVQNGGSLDQTSGTATFGSYNSQAFLRVNGLGSEARFRGTTQAGFNFGNGAIAVTEGARLVTPGATLGAAVEGTLRGSIDIRLDGPGSVWVPNGAVRVAAGELSVTDGARIDSAQSTQGSTFSLGSPGRTVIARIAGDASVPSRFGTLTVGDQGYANLLVEDGSDVVTNTTSIGATAQGSGAAGAVSGIVTITGRGTTWTTGQLLVSTLSTSSANYGELRVLDGAIFSATSTSHLNPASAPGTTARIVVDGTDSTLNLLAGTSTTAGFSAVTLGSSGSAEFTVSGGARQNSGALTVGSTLSSQGQGLARVSGIGSLWTVSGGGLNIQRGTVELADGGELVLTSSARAAATISPSGALVLRGGRLVLPSLDFPSLQNQGLISGDGEIQLTVSNTSTAQIAIGTGDELRLRGLTNTGSSGGVLVLGGALVVGGSRDSLFTNSGDIVVDAGRIGDLENTRFNPIFRNEAIGHVRVVGGANTFAAPLQNSGRVVVSGNSTASFFDAVTNSSVFSVSSGSTAFFLGDYTGAPLAGAGRAVFEGIVRQTGARRFGTDVELSGAARFEARFNSVGLVDRLLGEQTVSLGGELRLIGQGPLGSPGLQELTLVEAAAVLGEFDFTPAPGAHLGGRLVFRDVLYTDQSAKLVVEQLAAGDLNADGLIDAADGAAWAAAYGSTDWRADGNRDGVVDAADYSLWRDALAGPAPTAVPEPSTALWGAPAAAGLVIRRRC